MASKSVLFLALLLMASASVSHSLITVIYGTVQAQVDKVYVNGTLLCSLPPPPPTSPPCVNVVVSLSCDSGLTFIASATTDSSGKFSITVQTQLQLTIDSKCAVYASTPVANCAAFAQAGGIKAVTDSVQVDDTTSATIYVGSFNYY